MTPNEHRFLCECGLFYIADEPSACYDCTNLAKRLQAEERRMAAYARKLAEVAERDRERKQSGRVAADMKYLSKPGVRALRAAYQQKYYARHKEAVLRKQRARRAGRAA